MSEEIELLKQTILEDTYTVIDGSDDFEVVTSIELDQSRWHQWIQVIFKSLTSGKYYSYVYGRGLTEMQEDEHDSQPVILEVAPKDEVITITRWVLVEE